MRGRERNADGPRRFPLFMAVFHKISPAKIHEKGANLIKRIRFIPLNQVMGRYADGGHENGEMGQKRHVYFAAAPRRQGILLEKTRLLT